MSFATWALFAIVLIIAALVIFAAIFATGRNQPDPTAEENLPIRHRARKHRQTLFNGTATGRVRP